jgi:hypothetical protein
MWHTLSVIFGVSYLIWRERPRITVSALFLTGYILLYGPGFLYFLSVSPEVVDSIAARCLTAVALSWPFLVLGLEASRIAFADSEEYRARTMEKWRTTPMTDDPANDHWLFMAAVTLAVGLIGYFLATGKLGQVETLFTLATESERKQLRINAPISVGNYLYTLCVLSIGPFVGGLTFVRALVSRSPALWAASAVISLAVLLARFGTLTKSLWVIYLAQLGLTWVVTRTLRLRLGWTALGAGVVLVGLGIGSAIALPELSVTEIGGYLLFRIVQVANEVVYQTFYVYPDYVPHTNGLNIALLAKLAGGTVPAQAHTTVAGFFGAEGATFNAMFVAGAWVDFGYVGVAVVSFVVGFVLKAYDAYAVGLGKSSVSCALLAFALTPVDGLLATSAQTALLTSGLLLVPLIVMSVRYVLKTDAAVTRFPYSSGSGESR